MSTLGRTTSITSIDSNLSVDEYDQLFNSGSQTAALIVQAKSHIALHRAALQTPNVDYAMLFEGMLDYAIDEQGQRYAACVILVLAHGGVGLLKTGAKSFMDFLFSPMMSSYRKERAEPSEAQTPDFQRTVSTIEPSSRSSQGSLREKVREREKGACAITSFLDLASKEDSPPDYNTAFVPCQAAHIVPLCLNKFNPEKSGELSNASKTWSILQAWTSIDLEALVGDKIMDPSNCIYMSAAEYIDFGKFNFYLEPDPAQVDTYHVVLCRGMTKLSNTRATATVHFNTTSLIPPPNPKFIAMHAAFAKVLNLSGAAGYMNGLEKEDEEAMSRPILSGADFLEAVSRKLILAF